MKVLNRWVLEGEKHALSFTAFYSWSLYNHTWAKYGPRAGTVLK